MFWAVSMLINDSLRKLKLFFFLKLLFAGIKWLTATQKSVTNHVPSYDVVRWRWYFKRMPRRSKYSLSICLQPSAFRCFSMFLKTPWVHNFRQVNTKLIRLHCVLWVSIIFVCMPRKNSFDDYTSDWTFLLSHQQISCATSWASTFVGLV